MERSPAAPTFVGIDVAKDRLDGHLRPSNEALALSRDGAGLDALVARLVALRPALVVLEAIGGFEVAVAGALAAAGLPLVVVNPRQIRDFARATGRLAKTDRLDAEAIARFAEAVRPAPRPVPSAAAQALGELVARRRQLVERITREGQRRRQLRDPRLRRRLERMSPGCKRSSRRLKPTSTTRSAAPRPGAPPRTCSRRCPASARPRPAR